MFSTIFSRISLSQLSLSSPSSQITFLDGILAYLPLFLCQAIFFLSFYPHSVFQDTILVRLLLLWFNKPRLPREAVKHWTYRGLSILSSLKHTTNTLLPWYLIFIPAHTYPCCYSCYKQLSGGRSTYWSATGAFFQGMMEQMQNHAVIPTTITLSAWSMLELVQLLLFSSSEETTKLMYERWVLAALRTLEACKIRAYSAPVYLCNGASDLSEVPSCKIIFECLGRLFIATQQQLWY